MPIKPFSESARKWMLAGILGALGYTIGLLFPAEIFVGCSEVMKLRTGIGNVRYVTIQPIKGLFDVTNFGDPKVELVVLDESGIPNNIDIFDRIENPDNVREKKLVSSGIGASDTHGLLSASATVRIKLKTNEALMVAAAHSDTVVKVIRHGWLNFGSYGRLIATFKPCNAP